MSLMEQYLKEQKINGLSEATVYNLRSFLSIANEFKPLEQWTKDDIDNYVLNSQREYKKGTVELQKRRLKKFFRWAKKDIAEHLKIKDMKNTLRAEDILTIEEINLLIETTPSTLYKAMIAFLFESGARISEILSMKVKDFKETDRGLVASIPQTKTGEDYRPCLCIFSSQYIRNHVTYCALNPGDKIFDLNPVSVWEMLGKIADKAGITKPVHAHSFRHAQASDMVRRGYQESIIRKKLGWTGNSDMIERYIHLNDTDIINATLEKAGAEVIRQPMANIKQAESIKITDASMQLSKLNEEYEALKERSTQRDTEFEEMKRTMELFKKAIAAGVIDEADRKIKD